jgi:hypothetical protein
MTRSRDVADTQDNLGGAVPPFVSGKNVLINGQMDFWQRGTSFSSVSGGYTADRWVVDNAASVTRQAGTGPFTYCLRVTNTATNPAIRQAVELPATGNAGYFTIGSTWTVSFYARTSTSIASPLAFFMAFADVNGAGASADTIVSSLNIGASSTSWTRYTFTFTVSVAPSGTRTCIQVVPYLAAGAYAGNFEITGVQLEQGNVATPFARAGGSIGGELALCQRYYWRAGGQTSYQAFGTGIFESATGAWLVIQNPVPMRAAPSSIDWSTLAIWDGGAVRAVTGVTAGEFAAYVARVFVTVASGGTQFRPVQLFANNSTSAFVGFSAEL